MFTKPDEFLMIILVGRLKLASAPSWSFRFITMYSTQKMIMAWKKFGLQNWYLWNSWHWFYFLSSLYCFKIIIFYYFIFVIMYSKQAIDKQYLQNKKSENRLVIHFQKIISSWSCPFNESFERYISRNFCQQKKQSWIFLSDWQS